MAATTSNVVMGAWTREDLQAAVASLLGLDLVQEDSQSTEYFDQEKFDEVYFTSSMEDVFVPS
jgi:hypothetical protein